MPRRQAMVRHAVAGRAAKSSLAPSLLAEGPGCLAGLPAALGGAGATVTSAG